MLEGTMHSFNKYLLSKYYVPDTILGFGKLTVDNIDQKKKILVLMDFTYIKINQILLTNQFRL